MDLSFLILFRAQQFVTEERRTVGEIRQPWGITTQFSDTTLRFPGLIPDKSGLVQPVYLAVPDNYLVLANQKIANLS